VLKKSGRPGSRRGCLCCSGRSGGPFSLHQGLGFGEEEVDDEEPLTQERPAPPSAPPPSNAAEQKGEPPPRDGHLVSALAGPGWASTALLVCAAALAAYKLHRALRKA
jgi:hypothetical protein